MATSITKSDLAKRIHNALGLNSRFAAPSPEQAQDTLTSVNEWMLANNALGRRLGWTADSPGVAPKPEDETGLPDWALLGVVNSCAMLIAPYFDKQPSPIIMEMAAQGMNTIIQRTVMIKPQQYPDRMPKGQGNRTTYSNRWYQQTDPIETFNDFLEDDGGEVITS